MSITYKINRAIRFITFNKRPYTSAIILCGGSGTRLGGNVPKQLLTLIDKPVYMWSVLAFDSCPYIDEIVLVIKKGTFESVKNDLSNTPHTKKIILAYGKETRQKSAIAGLLKVSDKSKFVAFHDGARPCITTEEISDIVSEAYANKAASAVCPATDTVKILNSNNEIVSTVDRTIAAMAQTPQVFQKKLYMACAYSAKEQKAEVTDDNMLLERIGHKIKAVMLTKNNIKITNEGDLEIAEKILLERENKND